MWLILACFKQHAISLLWDKYDIWSKRNCRWRRSNIIWPFSEIIPKIKTTSGRSELSILQIEVHYCTSTSQILHPRPLFLFFWKPKQTQLLKTFCCLWVLATSYCPSLIPCLSPFPPTWPNSRSLLSTVQFGSFLFFLPSLPHGLLTPLLPPWTSNLPLGWSLDIGNLLAPICPSAPLSSQIPNVNHCLAINPH